MANVIDITTFGVFTVRTSGGELSPVVAQRRRMAVLLYLAASGNVGVTRERLLALFWPERNDESARNLLNQSLSAFRHLSPDLVRVGPAGDVHLEPALVSLDAVDFETHCQSKSWRQAVDLYHGHFLDGFALGSAPEFERWSERERERHERSYGGALEGMARAAASRSDLLEAEKWWRLRVALEPMCGRAVRALMQTLADAGERALAIEEARKYERILRIELSIEMDEATAALLRTIRRATRSMPMSESADRRLDHDDASSQLEPPANTIVEPHRASDESVVDNAFAPGIAENSTPALKPVVLTSTRRIAASLILIAAVAIGWLVLSASGRTHASHPRAPNAAARSHS